jgi:hypothetical protein
MSQAAEIERVDPLEGDIIAFKHIDKNLLKLEPELFRTKWFDYRMITPLQATELYVEAFAEIYRSYFAVEIDRRNAQHVRIPNFPTVIAGVEAGDRKRKTFFAGCWRGRQVADALGMPYKEFIHTVMGYRLRFWSQNHLPRPHQLYNMADVERTQERWQEMQAGRLYLAEHPAYMLENYAGIQHQDDYHEWLFAQAYLRSNPFEAMATFVNDNILPLSKVEARVDEDLIDRVHRHLQ